MKRKLIAMMMQTSFDDNEKMQKTAMIMHINFKDSEMIMQKIAMIMQINLKNNANKIPSIMTLRKYNGIQIS